MKTSLIAFAVLLQLSSLPALASGFGCSVFEDAQERIKLPVDVQLDSDSQTILYVRRGKLIADPQGHRMQDVLDERSYSFRVTGRSSRTELQLNLSVDGDVGRWLDRNQEESEWVPVLAKNPGHIHVKGKTEKVLRGKALLPFINGDRELRIRCEPFAERDYCGLFFCL